VLGDRDTITFTTADANGLPGALFQITRADGSTGEVGCFVYEHLPGELPLIVDDSTSPARGMFYAIVIEASGSALVSFSPELQEMLDFMAAYARGACEVEIVYRAPNGPVTRRVCDANLHRS